MIIGCMEVEWLLGVTTFLRYGTMKHFNMYIEKPPSIVCGRIDVINKKNKGNEYTL